MEAGEHARGCRKNNEKIITKTAITQPVFLVLFARGGHMLDQWDQQTTTQLRWIPPTPSDFLRSKPPLPSIYVDAQQFSLVVCRQRFLSFLARTPCWIYFGKNKQRNKAVLLVSSTAASSAFWRYVVVFLLFRFFRASIQKCGSRVKCGRRSSKQKV